MKIVEPKWQLPQVKKQGKGLEQDKEYDTFTVLLAGENGKIENRRVKILKILGKNVILHTSLISLLHFPPSQFDSNQSHAYR